MNNDEEIQQLKDAILTSKAAVVKIGGFELCIDLGEIAETVHFFASRYGLGGCKSISEYWDMIDAEDPVKMLLLRIAAKEAEEMGDKPVKAHDTEGQLRKVMGGGAPVRQHDGTEVVDNLTMADFLVNMGADPETVKTARKKVENRKIQRGVDLTYIPEHIGDDKFDVQKALDDFNDMVRQGENFKVSLGSMMGARKHGSRKNT